MHVAADRPHVMANVVVGRLAAFVDGTYGDLPVSADDLPSHVTADAREVGPGTSIPRDHRRYLDTVSGQKLANILDISGKSMKR